MPICLCQNEYSRTLSGTLSVTFDLYHWLLWLASVLIYTTDYFERTLSPTCEHYNVNEHPRNPSGYFRYLSNTIVDYFSSAFVNRHINLLLITSNARYCQLVNTIMSMNTLAILWGNFGNFRTLSLTSSACVNLQINLLLIILRKELSQPCKQHYNVNKHPRHPSRYFR